MCRFISPQINVPCWCSASHKKNRSRRTHMLHNIAHAFWRLSCIGKIFPWKMKHNFPPESFSLWWCEDVLFLDVFLYACTTLVVHLWALPDLNAHFSSLFKSRTSTHLWRQKSGAIIVGVDVLCRAIKRPSRKTKVLHIIIRLHAESGLESLRFGEVKPA